ncbi:MAG: hypothetical protein ACJ8E4_10350 [Sphingomicrobium sp.]
MATAIVELLIRAGTAVGRKVEQVPRRLYGATVSGVLARFGRFVLQSHGSAWLLLGRQDAQFRAEYRRSLRLPLVRSLNSYLVKHRHGARLAKISNAQLAELLVTAIESVVVNHDDDLALALECNDAIDHLVRAIFEAYL